MKSNVDTMESGLEKLDLNTVKFQLCPLLSV